MIAERLARLDKEDHRLLGVAAVVGAEFAIDTVAAVLGGDEALDELEERAELLAQRTGLLRPLELVVADDGSYSGRYAFSHALIQAALYETLPELRRARLHARVAEEIESRVRSSSLELASSLARHFEAGRQPARAIDYLLRAARTASRRFANDTALQHLEHAAQLVVALPKEIAAEYEHRLLLDRGHVQRSSGDMRGASDSWAALAANARDACDSDAEIRALLLLASSQFWLDRTACLDVVERARSIAHQARDPVLTAHAQGWCAHWNLTLRGWSDESAAMTTRAIEVLREREREDEGGSSDLLGLHLVRSTYMHMLCSDYAAATAASEEGTRLALERGDAFDYMLGYFLRAWAQLHAGNWSDLLACLSFGQRIARKNGHALWDHLFGLIEAQLRAHAFDFERASELGALAIDYADRHPEEAGQLRFHGKIAVAHAALGLGQLDSAAAALENVEVAIAQHPHEVDWMLHLPLRQARSRLCIVRGETELAIEEARSLHELAATSGERSYIVFAAVLMAEANIARGELGEAQRALGGVDAICDDSQTPLAAWRYHAIVAFFGKGDERLEADKRSEAILTRLTRELRSSAPGLAKTMAAARRPQIKQRKRS